MKTKFLLIILFLATFNAVAQDPKLSENFTVSVGEEYGETDGRIRNFYKYKDYVVGINRHKSHFVIQKFDPKELKEVERIEKEKFFKNKRTDGFENIIRLGDNILMFYAQWDRKAKIESLEYQSISLETLEMTDFKELIKQEGKVAGKFAFTTKKVGFLGMAALSGKTYDKYHYRTNFSEGKLLVTYRLKPKSRDDSKSYDRISINVFDDQLNKEWSGIVEMPYTEEKMDNTDYGIDKEGNFFMLAKVYEDVENGEKKKKKKKKEENYHLEILKVKKGTETIVNTKIDMADKFVDEVILYEDVNGEMVLAGTSKNPDTGTSRVFFSTKQRGQATGVFRIKLNEDGSLGAFKNYDFPAEMLAKNASKSEKKSIDKKKEEGDEEEKPGFADLKIRNIVANQDGSFLILGEQYYVITRTSYNATTGASHTSYTYYYRDILAAKINQDGSLAWMHKLPKRSSLFAVFG